jgi:hypothetical protein
LANARQAPFEDADDSVSDPLLLSLVADRIAALKIDPIREILCRQHAGDGSLSLWRERRIKVKQSK